jgi:hypothetical protein
LTHEWDIEGIWKMPGEVSVEGELNRLVADRVGIELARRIESRVERGRCTFDSEDPDIRRKGPI